MKLKDIEVGKAYADTYGNKIVVLEVGVYGRVYHDRVGSGRSDHRHYVKIKTKYDHDDTAHYRSVVRPWVEQEEIDKKKAERISLGEAEVSRLWSILESNTSLTRRSHWPSTRIELDHEEVTKVCKAFVKHGQPKIQSTD